MHSLCMETVFLIAQITGFIALLINVASMQRKCHISIIRMDISADFIWVIHFLFLGGLAGALTCFIAFARSLAFVHFNKKYFNFICYIAVLSTCALCLGNYQNIYSLLPPLTFAIGTYGIIANNRRTLSSCIFMRDLIWLAYGISVGSFFFSAASVICIASCIIGKVRHERLGAGFTPRLISLFPKVRPFPRPLQRYDQQCLDHRN